MNEKIDELINMIVCLQHNVKNCLEDGSSHMMDFTINCHFNLVLDKAREIKAELE